MREQRPHKMARNYAKVGEYLQELRARAGLTQRTVSMALGYSSAQFISNFERGIVLPPIHKMKMLQEMYKGDVNRLVELTVDAERKLMVEALKSKSKGKLH